MFQESRITRSRAASSRTSGAVERAALTRLGIPPVTPDAEDLERLEALADLETVRGEVAAALGALSGDQREAVQMRVVGEMEYADIAVKVGVTEDVVRARVSRGLRTLAGDLKPAELRDAGHLGGQARRRPARSAGDAEAELRLTNDRGQGGRPGTQAPVGGRDVLRA